MTNAESSRNYRRRHPERANAATKKWRENHRALHRQLSLKWGKSNKDRVHVARRKWQYGITDYEFETKKTAQDNRCAICLEVFTKTPCIDHDHATDKNRGLLCRFCNLVLGNAKDRILVLERAIQYLKEYGG
jgi:hypothetical protein